MIGRLCWHVNDERPPFDLANRIVAVVVAPPPKPNEHRPCDIILLVETSDGSLEEWWSEDTKLFPDPATGNTDGEALSLRRHVAELTQMCEARGRLIDELHIKLEKAQVSK